MGGSEKHSVITPMQNTRQLNISMVFKVISRSRDVFSFCDVSSSDMTVYTYEARRERSRDASWAVIAIAFSTSIFALDLHNLEHLDGITFGYGA
jgi:hypothetical protein